MKTIVKMPTTGVEYSIPKVPEEVSAFTIFSEFSKFGAVEDLWRKENGEYRIAIVLTRNVDKFLSNARILIRGDLIKITRKRTYRQHWMTRPRIPTKSSAVSILMLSDDCLREIFKKSAIGFDELTKLSYVCRRFNNILSKMSKSKAAIEEKNFVTINNRSMWKTNAILRALGPRIQNAKILAKSEVISEMVLNYCPYLDHLCAEKPEVTYVMKRKKVEAPPPMRFERDTQHLNLNKCEIPVSLPKMLYPVTPHVVQLNLYAIKTINFRSYYDFVDHNKHLQQVNFSNVPRCIIEYASFFACSFPNEIEKLTFNYKSQFDATLLIKQYSDKPNMHRVAKPLSIPPSQSNFIYKLKYLKYLRTNKLGDRQMVVFAEDLKELEEIYVASNDITYAGIYKILKGATSLRVAYITTTSNDYTEEKLARIDAVREKRGLTLDVKAYCNASNNDLEVHQTNHSKWFQIVVKNTNQAHTATNVNSAFVTFNFHEAISMAQSETEADIRNV